MISRSKHSSDTIRKMRKCRKYYWKQHSKIPCKDMLLELYNKQKMSTISISKIYNVSDGSVLNWLKKYNIKRRKNTEHFKGSKKTYKIKTKIAKSKQDWWDSHPEMKEIRSEELKGKNNPQYGMSGSKSPVWRGGYIQEYGCNWHLQRKKRLKKDKYTCQRCKNKEKVQVHHIIPFRLFGLKRYIKANRLYNLITLCIKCHSIVEKQNRGINNDELFKNVI